MLVGDVPNDIDIRLAQAGDVPGFLLDLTKLGTVTITGGAKYGNLGGIKVTITTTTKLPMLDDYEGINLDIIWAPYDGCVVVADPDVDVNHLTLSRTGIGHIAKWPKLLEILDNISKRQFKSDYKCPPARIQKMVAKGWVWLNEPKQVPDCPLSNAELEQRSEEYCENGLEGYPK
jgi:hypothetical protein